MIQLTDKEQELPRSRRFLILPILITCLIVTKVFNYAPSFSFEILGFAAPTTPVLDVFEIQQPFVFPLGSNVSTLLLNTTVETSKKFHPLNFTATTGFLTLNVTNTDAVDSEGIVGEILVDTVPIWRFASPNGKLNTITKSSTVKNITQFLNLFNTKSKVEFVKLEGSSDVQIELELSLFNDNTTYTNGIFESNGPADVVYALDSIPAIPANITSGKLLVFASPLKDEITYYKNDIDGTNGPLRYLNVFVDDVYIQTVTPKPTLYHSNKISGNPNTTNLWTPLSDTGSFSGLSYEVDLISVLPLLYQGAKVEIEVVSPVVAATPPGVPGLPHPVIKGSSLPNWSISGSFLGWASPVLDISSDFIIGESSELDSGVLINPPATSPYQPSIKNEIVKSSIKGGLITQFNVTLPTGVFNYSILTNTSIHNILTKQSKEIKKLMGPPGSGLGSTTTTTTLILISGSKFNVEVTDIDTGLTYLTKNSTAEFPFTLDETLTETKSVLGPSSSSSVKAEINADIKTKVNDVKESFKVKEKLTIDEIKGVSTDIDVKIKGDVPYEREVQVDNGVIVKDTSVLSVF